MPAGQVCLHGTCDSSLRATSSVRSISAPVGQTVTQAEQNLQPDSIRVGAMVPTHLRPSVSLTSRQPTPRTSLQATRQRRQSMHRL
jgi:hypothetical protein